MPQLQERLRTTLANRYAVEHEVGRGPDYFCEGVAEEIVNALNKMRFPVSRRRCSSGSGCASGSRTTATSSRCEPTPGFQALLQRM